MFTAYRSKDDPNLTRVSRAGEFPRHFDLENWIVEAETANVTPDIAKEVTQLGFILMQANLPIGHRTTYGLMP